MIHSFRTADLQCRKRPLYPTEPQQSPIQLECCHDSVVRGEVVASRKGFDELIFPSRSMLRSCLRLRLEERKRRSVFFYFFFFLFFFFFSERKSVALRSKWDVFLFPSIHQLLKRTRRRRFEHDDVDRRHLLTKTLFTFFGVNLMRCSSFQYNQNWVLHFFTRRYSLGKRLDSS